MVANLLAYVKRSKTKPMQNDIEKNLFFVWYILNNCQLYN